MRNISGCLWVLALFGVAGLVVWGVVMIVQQMSQPDSITDKYQCTQTVNGQQQTAYCVADSAGNSYYVPWNLYNRVRIGQYDTTGGLAPYTRAAKVPTEEIPPAERSVISSHITEHGGEESFHGGFHGGGGR